MISLDDFFETLGNPNIIIENVLHRKIYEGSAYYYVKNYLYPEEASILQIEAIKKNTFKIIVDFCEDYQDLEDEVINGIIKNYSRRK